jgi:hypothetical protein
MKMARDTKRVRYANLARDLTRVIGIAIDKHPIRRASRRKRLAQPSRRQQLLGEVR